MAPLTSNFRARRYRLEPRSAQAGNARVAEGIQQCSIIVAGSAIDPVGRPPSSLLQLLLELLELEFLGRGQVV